MTWTRGHQPSADPRANQVQPLDSAGVGGGRTPPDKLPWGLTLALLAGIVAPLAILVWLFWGSMGPVARVSLGVGVALVIGRGVVKARAARQRARDRAAARAAVRAG